MTFASDEISVVSGQPVELYKFVLRNTSTEWFFTSAGYDITYSGDTYVATSGISRSQVEEIEDTLKSELKITMPSSHSFPQLFLFYTPNGIIDFTLFRGHSTNFVQYWKGVVQVVNPLDPTGNASILLVPPTTLTQSSPLIRTYQRSCDVPLYSSACTLLASNFKVNATLLSVSGITLTSTTFDDYADDYFTGGYIFSNNMKRKIKSHSGTTITLVSQMPGLSSGASVEAYPGCDHSRSTCNTKFSNLPNYRGCDWIPDNEPFTQGILK